MMKTRLFKKAFFMLFVSALLTLGLPRWTHPVASQGNGPTIMFVTQAPFGADFTTVNSTFGNHQSHTGSAPRGGDLYLRYGDGTLRNLTAEAGFGVNPAPGQHIAVREPSVHWSGTKALFSMIIGGTIKDNLTPVYWQIYEVTGLGQGQIAQITKLPQLANYNNVSPIYGTDDRIIFTSDRPRNGDQLTYPQLDEYESAQTNTGIWSMKPDGTDLKLLDHSVSGDFSPILASDGRLLFIRWDHLQRDQQNDAGTYGAFNYLSEASTQNTGVNTEIFPEPRVQPSNPFYHRHTFNQFFPWQINEDGTGMETLNHVGRHELLSYFDSAHDGLPEFIASETRRTAANLFQIRESPTQPGYFYFIAAPEFATHAAGQIVGLNGGLAVNPDNMQLDYITDIESRFAYSPGDTIPPNHPGHFRNPTPLSNGTLIAVHSDSPLSDSRPNGPLSSLYNFRLVNIQSGNPATKGSRLIPNGITKSITYWDNYSYQQLSYSGQMWELDPVEVIARNRPSKHTDSFPAIETQILSEELGGQAGIDQLRAFLQQQNLALVVSRNVTRRADKQQDVNLRIKGTNTQTVEPGQTPIDIDFMQFLQGDLIRGYSNFHGGRRPIAQIMHDGLNPAVTGAPAGTVKLGADGSMAAFVPAKRALSWQMTQTDGTPIVRERYWVTFAPGEMRSCVNCHGLNNTDIVVHQPPPTNPPQALRDLAIWYRNNFAAQAPTVTRFYPIAATTGKTVVITGTNFAPGNTQVFFGGVNLIPANVTNVTSTQITVTVPASDTGIANINGYLTIRVNGGDITTQGIPANAPNPGTGTATFPEFILWGDANRDGRFATNDVALARAFSLLQATPTAQQLLAVDVVPSNGNGSRGDGNLTATDFSLLRAVSFGQTTF